MNKKRIAIVAHDLMKKDMIEWVTWNKEILASHKLTCTGTTGRLIKETFTKLRHELPNDDFEIKSLKSGPLGGDQQLGALIAKNKIDILFFFWDPMQPQPHDVDVKALLRIAVLYNIPTASNRTTADYIISSPLFNEDYEPKVKDYNSYIQRSISKL